MDSQTELLQIERERLVLEKRRDKTSAIRFVIGTILLAIGTTGVTVYFSEKQVRRSLISSQRQLVVPMLVSMDPLQFDQNIIKIDELLDVGLTPEINTLLRTRRVQIVQNQAEFAEQEKLKLAAVREAEKRKRAADVQTLRAVRMTDLTQKSAAEQQAKIAQALAVKASESAAMASTKFETTIKKLRIDTLRPFGTKIQ